MYDRLGMVRCPRENMKFNPITNELFTNDDRFIKKLSCPYMMRWLSLVPLAEGSVERARQCQNCQRPVLDTAQYTEAEILARQQQQPDLCLKIDVEGDQVLLVTS